MTLSKDKIRKIIHEVMNEDREPLKDILAHNNTEDVVHATHLAWDGGEKGGPEAENLVMPIDRAAAVGSEEVTSGIEVIDHASGEVVTVDDREFSNENLVRKLIKSLL